MLQTEIADRERHLTDLSEHVERQAVALKIYRQGAHGLDLSDPHGNLANSSDSQSRGQAQNELPTGQVLAALGVSQDGLNSRKAAQRRN